MTYVLPVDQSYSAAVECLEKNAVKGNYTPKKLYEGKEIMKEMNISSYNAARLLKSTYFNVNLGNSETRNNAVYNPSSGFKTNISRPSNFNPTISRPSSRYSTLLSYTK
jgi:hypothetical protein